MACFIPCNGPVQHGITTPLDLPFLQGFVGGFIDFVETESGHLMVVNENSEDSPVNHTATAFAGIAIHGDAVMCLPGDIA